MELYTATVPMKIRVSTISVKLKIISKGNVAGFLR